MLSLKSFRFALLASSLLLLYPFEVLGCQSGTLYPKPNCNEYYLCYAGNFVPYKCNPGQHFSYSQQKCTTIQSANCFCRNLKDGKYPLGGCYPTIIEQYVTCQLGNVVEVNSCERFFIFDAKDPQSSFCTKAATSCQLISTGFCAEMAPGNYYIPGTCTSYMQCIPGFNDGIMQNCTTASTVYSIVLDRCVSDVRYPINCGGLTGYYMSLDGSTSDIRQYARAVLPLNVMTGLSEVVSSSIGVYSGAVPTLVSNIDSIPQNAFLFASDYLLPKQSLLNFVGDPEWTFYAELKVDTAAFSTGSNFEFLNFQSLMLPAIKYASLVAVSDLGNYHFEVQCPCQPASAGTVSVQNVFATPLHWGSVTITFSSNLLTIYLNNAAHVIQSPFSCFADCGMTAAGKKVNLQVKQGAQAACLILLIGIADTSNFKPLVCPTTLNAVCPLSSAVATFDYPSITPADIATMTCSDNPQMKATIGCSSVPLSADCSWTEYNSFNCTNHQFTTLWDDSLFCYQGNGTMRALFPFNYITQLRDISYGLVSWMQDALVTKTIDATNVLTLYDGIFVIGQSLELNFGATFSILFYMTASSGINLRYKSGDTAILEANIYYETLSGTTKVKLATMGSSNILLNCSLNVDIRDKRWLVEISADSLQTLTISLNQSYPCATVISQPLRVFGNFEMQAAQPTSNDYCSVSCLLFLNQPQSAVNNSNIYNTYCDPIKISQYYTMQLLSAWPLNIVSSATDMFGLNDITSPSYLTYKVFSYTPAPMPAFSAVNMSAVLPAGAMSMNDFRSAMGSTSDDFSVSFWLYVGRPNQIITVANNVGIVTFSMQISSLGVISVGISFNIGYLVQAFASQHALSTWHYYSLSFQRRTRTTYEATLMVFDVALSLESAELKTISLPANAAYQTLDYVRGKTVTVSGSSSYISCMTYLDRAILTASDAIYNAQMCPSFSAPCDSTINSQVAAMSFYLPDSTVFDNMLDTDTSICRNTSQGDIPVPSVCIIDRSIYLSRESCEWSLSNNRFECYANRSLLSPPCGSPLPSQELIQDFLSTVNCPILSPPQNGSVAFSDQKFTGGSTATFSCNNGSYVVGQSSVSCQLNATWTGSVPTCKYVDCGNPTTYLLNNFNVETIPSPIKPTYYAVVAPVQCIPGFVTNDTLPAVTSITCMTTGAWTDPPMTCQRGSCGIPTHGFSHVVIGTYMYQDTVTLKCLSGTQFATGDIAINKTCNASLVWTPADDLPDCIELRCPPPTSLGQLMTFTPIQADYALGSVVTMSCVNSTYMVIGEKVRTCLPTQQWSGTDPYCQIRECGDPGDVVGASRLYNSFAVNETITYTCNTGFKMTGNPTISCLSNGLWDATKPMCTKLDCGIPPNGTEATVVYSTTTYNDTALYTCTSGFIVVSGDSSRRCLATKAWSGSPPVCKKINCAIVELLEGTMLNSTTNKTSFNFGETLELACKPGYRWAGGSLSRSCSMDGTWSGQALYCEPKVCGVPYPRSKMASYKPSGSSFNFLQVVTYTCVDGYTLAKGDLTRTCLDDGSWSGTAPECTAPPGQDPPTQVSAVTLKPTEAKNAVYIGIPVGAVFMGVLLGLLLLFDIMSGPKYFEFAKRRYTKAGFVKPKNPPAKKK